MAQPVEIANGVNSSLKPSLGCLVKVMTEVLIRSHGLQLFSAACIPHTTLCDSKKVRRTSPEAIFAVLDHIARRTLPFDKFLEFVERSDIVSGKPSLAIAPACSSKAHIVNALSYLSPPHSKVLIKIQFKNIGRLLYGINFPAVFQRIYDQMIQDLEDYYQVKNGQPSLSVVGASTLGQTFLCCKYLEQYGPAFKLLAGIKGKVNPADLEDLKADIKAEVPKSLLILDRDDWKKFRNWKRINHNWQESMRKGRPFNGIEAS